MDDADMFVVDIVTAELKDYDETIKKYIDDKIAETSSKDREHTNQLVTNIEETIITRFETLDNLLSSRKRAQEEINNLLSNEINKDMKKKSDLML